MEELERDKKRKRIMFLSTVITLIIIIFIVVGFNIFCFLNTYDKKEIINTGKENKENNSSNIKFDLYSYFNEKP